MNTQSAVNAAVEAAKDLPDLVAKVSAVDPALAQQLTGKALVASRSPWGTLAAGAVALVAAKYGLGWDQATCDLLAGIGVLLGAFAMRAVTGAPITSLFGSNTTSAPAQAAATPAVPVSTVGDKAAA